MINFYLIVFDRSNKNWGGVTITAKELDENIANASAMFDKKKYRKSKRGTFVTKRSKARHATNFATAATP